MEKITRNMMIIFAVALMIMMMTVPSFAASGNGWYNQGSAPTYTDPITVKVVVQSRKYVGASDYINGTFDITLGQANMNPTSFTVSDVLGEFNNQQSTLQANPTYYQIGVLYNMKKLSNGNIYGPVLYNSNGYELDGWMFKVNGKFPTSTQSDTNASGISAANTYIADGDVIYFYTDCPWKINNTVFSTYFISADTSYSNGTLTVTLMKNQNYYQGIGSSATWTIDDYTAFTPTTQYSAVVKDAAGTTVGNVVLQNGTGTKNITLTQGQNYYVSVLGTRNWHTINGTDSNGNPISVSHLYTTIAYDKVNH